MIVVLKPHITKRQEAAVLKEIEKLGYKPHVMRGVARTVIGAIGDERTHASLETPKVQAFRHWLLPEMERFRNILSQWT